MVQRMKCLSFFPPFLSILAGSSSSTTVWGSPVLVLFVFLGPKERDNYMIIS